MGMWRGRPVTYQVIDGRNIYQGDIILENVQPMPQAGGAHPASVGLADAGFLWDKVGGVAQIPYEIDAGSSDVANIQSAISIYNSTFAGVIQFVPHNTQTNWVDLNLNGFANGSCEAEEGDAHNGEQMVNGATNCTVPTILHEFGHVTGVWHEQSRDDASQYVTINQNSVIKGSIGDFEPDLENDQQYLTLYDFASVMQYPPFSFARNAGPALDSIPPGMPLSNSVGYSPADVEGIMRLYGVAPTEVTVTSNPPGLQVTADSTTFTTPMTFTWALNSMHMLSVASGVQTVSGDIVGSTDPTTFYYEYGRWNDNGAQSHSITVTQGNGDIGFPASAPQVATYTANFIQLVPFTFTVSTSSSGTGTVNLTGTPSPQSLTVNGVPGTYVVARQLATLTAVPATGSKFYAFINGPFFLSGGTGANPKQFYVPDSGLTIDPLTEFTKSPVYTVDVSPDVFDASLGVSVDGAFWETPKNFSPDANLDGSAWNPATTHNLVISPTQQLFSVNTKYDFVSWNTGATPTNAAGNTITLPATSSSFIATLTPSFVPATNFDFGGPCGGNGAITPASTDSGFYPSGTQLTFTATPSTTTPAGQWIFAGWMGDVTGTTNPIMLTPTDESLVNANFNTAAAPLTITSLSPASVVAGSSNLTVTITGTGFTKNVSGGMTPVEIVGFNFTQGGPTFPITFVSSTQIMVTIPAAAIATPGTFLLYIENYPSSGGCAVFAHQAFFVSQPAPTVTVTVTPTTLTFGSQLLGTSSASQGVTVKNTSTLSTTLSVGAATGDFAESGTTCGSSLGAGASCTFNVTFTPTATGTRTGSISITDQATNSPQSVSLTGTGFSVIVAPTPSSLTFTSQTVGTTSASQPVSVKNTGTGTTTLSIGTPTGDFAQTNTCSSTLAAGASCTVNVTFTPTATGTRTGSFLITDQASNSPQTVSLTGTGSSGTVTITVTPAMETFAAQALNTTSASKAVTVKNTGTASTTISIAPATGDFAQTNGCGSLLGAAASCTINVTFTPTAIGTRTGSIMITDQASNSPQSVSLTGTGVAQVTLSPTTLAFGNEAVGSTTAAKIVTMTNNLSTTLSGISFSAGTNYSAVAGTTTPCGATLASKAHCTISVTFSPTTTGSLPGTLTVMDSANNSPQMATLSGTGTAPVVITVTPASETFAAQAVGSTSAGKVITVKNTGGQSTSIATALSGDFTAPTNTCNGTLGAGATCTITATFTPSTTGSISGVITITDQGLNSPQIVTLTGTAVAPVTFSAASLAFGSQAVDTTSTPAKTVTMKNNSPNMLSGITIAASGNYSLPASGTPCGSSLAAGATCIISVTFTPTANGSIDGAVTVTYPGAYNPQEVKLTGTGTGGGTSPLKFTPASIAFASQGVGSTSAGKTVTVQNISASPVTFSSIATSGNFSEAGSGTTPCTNTSVLAASGSCTLSVTFTPSIAGAIQGALVISDNATPVGQQVVNLTGTAVLPVTIAPASLTFASQTHNTTSPPQTLTLTNNSGATLTSLSFAGSADFSVAPGTTMPCSTSLAAGAKCTLSVTFTPGRTGSIPGAATITDGASTSPQVVKLTGTGS
jgi:hypothetical protein